MRNYWLAVLSVLTVAPLSGIATPLAPPWDDMSVKHAWDAVPADWESLGPPPPSTAIDLHIALKPHNEDALIDALYEASTPGHPKYGAHLSKEDVAKLVAPHSDTFELVHSWLTYHGVQSSSISTTHGGSWLTLTGVLVSQANELLGASYQFYRHTGTNDSTILRTVGYALPTVLHAHVQTVAPTTFFSPTRTLRQTPLRHPAEAAEATAKLASRELLMVPSSRDDPPEPKAVTPEFLRWLYKTVTYVPAATSLNKLGVKGSQNEYASPDDLTMFMTVLRNDAKEATFTVEQVNGGGYDPSNPGGEASLDMQYAQAIAYPTPHIFYSVGGSPRWSLGTYDIALGDSYLAWIDHLLDQENIPQTVTVSYGNNEKDLPAEYAKSVCLLLAELGARGVSVLFSSGDNGVGAGDCDDGYGRVKFMPTFPASCPYITSVGGTTGSNPEVAVDFSGGGFSNFFARPKYQDVAVPTFLNQFRRNPDNNHYNGLYNASGRGIPDIAAQAFKFLVVVHTNPVFISGTSGATPTVAGIISLLNDFLISKGQPPLGFLNPWLYGGGLAGFTDITSGSNPGCYTDGFPAIVGWDPVTGLGTPDFLKLQDILLSRIAGQGRLFSELLNNSDTSVPQSRYRPN